MFDRYIVVVELGAEHVQENDIGNMQLEVQRIMLNGIKGRNKNRDSNKSNRGLPSNISMV